MAKCQMSSGPYGPIFYHASMHAEYELFTRENSLRKLSVKGL